MDSLNQEENIQLNLKSISLNGRDVKFHLNSEWGSSHESYRISIRKALFELSGNQEESLLDLNSIPLKISERFVSISHCPTVGGFALSNEGPLGFDIEDLDRVRAEHIRRFANAETIEAAPHLELLWPIGEALIKATTNHSTKSEAPENQLKILNESILKYWCPVENGGYKFECWRDNKSVARGFTIKNSSHVLAIVISL